MIGIFMLPTRPDFVKTGTALAERGQRARRNWLTALVVLSAHALLLALAWNGSPRRAALPPALVEATVLAPSGAGNPAAASRHLGPASRLPPAASHARQAVPQTAAQPRPDTLSPAPSTERSPVAAVTAAAIQPLPNQGAAQASDAARAIDPGLPAGQAAGSGHKAASGPAPSAAAARIELPDSSAGYLDNPRPVYPPVSRRLGEQGRVLLRIWVDADGRPGKVELKTSSGFERLDRAAQQTVQRWRFVPGKRAGMPEAMWAEVPLQFVLE